MKVLTGKVVSTKMQGTAVVEVVRRTPHPLYKKLMRISKKFKVDSTGTDVQEGDTVRIVEAKKMAKGKYFKILTENNKKEGEKS